MLGHGLLFSALFGFTLQFALAHDALLHGLGVILLLPGSQLFRVRFLGLWILLRFRIFLGFLFFRILLRLFRIALYFILLIRIALDIELRRLFQGMLIPSGIASAQQFVVRQFFFCHASLLVCSGSSPCLALSIKPCRLKIILL